MYFYYLTVLYDAHFLRGLADIDVDSVVCDLHLVLELVDTVEVVITVETILFSSLLAVCRNL